MDKVAETFEISRNTARAWLRAVMGKTGTRRQAEVVRVLLHSVPAAAAAHQRVRTG